MRNKILLSILLTTVACTAQRYDYCYDEKPKCKDIELIIGKAREAIGMDQQYNLCYDPNYRSLGMRPLKEFIFYIEGLKTKELKICDSVSIQKGAEKCVKNDIKIIDKWDYYDGRNSDCDIVVAISDIVIAKNKTKWVSVDITNCKKREKKYIYINYDLEKENNIIKTIDVPINDYGYNECKQLEEDIGSGPVVLREN